MDIDKFLLDQILAVGKLNALIDAGLQADDFQGPSKEIAAFIYDFSKNPRNKGTLPTAKIVERKFPAYKWQRHKEALPYLIDQVKERSDYNFITDTMATIGKALKGNRLDQARKVLRQSGLTMASRDARTHTVSLTRNMEERKTRYQQRRDKISLYGVPTGFKYLDALTLGYQPGDFAMWMAKSGIGKTWLLMLMGHAAQISGENVMLVAPEMSAMKLEMRYDALHARLPYRGIRMGELGRIQESHYFKTLAQLKTFADFEIPEFEGPCTPLAILAKAEELKTRYILVDGVYMLDDDEGERAGWEKHENIAKGIKKRLCKSGKIVVVSNQLNADEDQWNATLENSAYGKAYARYADIAGKLMAGSDERAAKQMKMQMLKLREEECPRKPFRMTWDFDTMKFDVEGEDEGGTVAPAPEEVNY